MTCRCTVRGKCAFSPTHQPQWEFRVEISTPNSQFAVNYKQSQRTQKTVVKKPQNHLQYSNTITKKKKHMPKYKKMIFFCSLSSLDHPLNRIIKKIIKRFSFDIQTTTITTTTTTI